MGNVGGLSDTGWFRPGNGALTVCVAHSACSRSSFSSTQSTPLLLPCVRLWYHPRHLSPAARCHVDIRYMRLWASVSAIDVTPQIRGLIRRPLPEVGRRGDLVGHHGSLRRFLQRQEQRGQLSSHPTSARAYRYPARSSLSIVCVAWDDGCTPPDSARRTNSRAKHSKRARVQVRLVVLVAGSRAHRHLKR